MGVWARGCPLRLPGHGGGPCGVTCFHVLPHVFHVLPGAPLRPVPGMLPGPPPARLTLHVIPQDCHVSSDVFHALQGPPGPPRSHFGMFLAGCIFRSQVQRSAAEVRAWACNLVVHARHRHHRRLQNVGLRRPRVCVWPRVPPGGPMPSNKVNNRARCSPTCGNISGNANSSDC